MAQIAVPTSDADNTGGWTKVTGGSGSNLYQDVDEDYASPDLVIIESPSNPVNKFITFKLGPLTDPLSSVGHTWRVRARKDQAAGQNMQAFFYLHKGYVSEASPGTQIGFRFFTTSHGENWTDDGATLNLAADDITDYNDLFIRCNANKSSGGQGRRLQIDCIELSIPDAPTPSDAIKRYPMRGIIGRSVFALGALGSELFTARKSGIIAPKAPLIVC